MAVANTARLSGQSLAPAKAASGSTASMRTSQLSRRSLRWLGPGDVCPGDVCPGDVCASDLTGEPAGSGMWLLIQPGMPRATVPGGTVEVRLSFSEGAARGGMAPTGSERIWRIICAGLRTSALWWEQSAEIRGDELRSRRSFLLSSRYSSWAGLS